MARSKIVVTGLGALAPNGNSVDQFWANSIAGKSGIGPVSQFNTEGHRVTIAGELSDFDPESVLDSREVRKLDPFSIYAITAADEAVTMAGIDPDKLDLDRVGVTIGTGVGGIQTLEDQHTAIETRGPRRVSPLFVPKMIANIAGGHLSMRWGFRGPNQTVTSACASATDAIGMAMRLILAGDADVMLAGGTEASVTGLCIAGFANMKALSQSCTEPEKASRPFDADRDGFVLGEGAGILVPVGTYRLLPVQDPRGGDPPFFSWRQPNLKNTVLLKRFHSGDFLFLKSARSPSLEKIFCKNLKL